MLLLLFCYCYVCMHMSAEVPARVRVWRLGVELDVFLYYPLPYCFETGSLMETGITSWLAGVPLGSTCHTEGVLTGGEHILSSLLSADR